MTDVPAIDPVEFEFMFAYLSERVDLVALKNSGIGRKAYPAIIEPLKERYKEPEKKKRGHFMFRWMALQRLVWSGALPAAFYNPATNEIHYSVIRLAARFPVLPKIQFDQGQFLLALQAESSES